MTAAAAQLLAGWRAWRAAQTAEPVPGVPGAAKEPGTEANPQKSRIVPGVPAVRRENEEGCTERHLEPLVARKPAGHVWGLTETEKAAALARLAGTSSAPEQTAALRQPADWWQLPYGEARGRAFTEARATRGFCSCCAGRRWWREADEAPPGRCAACHPPPPGLTITVTEMRGGIYRPGQTPDPLRDGLLRGARTHTQAKAHSK